MAPVLAQQVLQPTGSAAEQNAAASVVQSLVTAQLHAAREWSDEPSSLNAAAAPALGYSQCTGGGLPSHRAAEDDSAAMRPSVSATEVIDRPRSCPCPYIGASCNACR